MRAVVTCGRRKEANSLTRANALRFETSVLHEERPLSGWRACCKLCRLCCCWPPCLCFSCCCFPKTVNYFAMAKPNEPTYTYVHVTCSTSSQRLRIRVCVLQHSRTRKSEALSAARRKRTYQRRGARPRRVRRSARDSVGRCAPGLRVRATVRRCAVHHLVLTRKRVRCG